MTQLLPSVSGGKAQSLRNVLQPALKSMLSVVFGLVCLLMLMSGTSQAKGGRGGHSSASRGPSHGSSHRQNFVPKYKHKHKHKHVPGVDGDVDAPSLDADLPDASDAGEAAEAEAPEVVLYGVEITALFKGTAAKEGLGIGDIILKVNGTPTPTFEALTKALAQSSGRAEVLVIREDDDDDEPETVTLFPQNGVIGVSVEPVRVD
jgi:membrane-associated protease RseP (regulator of RpoE activity)